MSKFPLVVTVYGILPLMVIDYDQLCVFFLRIVLVPKEQFLCLCHCVFCELLVESEGTPEHLACNAAHHKMVALCGMK
jgi:hypothetical protein